MDRKLALAATLAACCATLVACGTRDRDAAGASTGGDVESPLPKPEAGSGSVTGMPDAPGPGHVGAPATEGDAMLPTDDGGEGEPAMPTDDTLPAPPDDATQVPPPAQPAAEPSAADAASVVRAYYAAIAARQYPRAYALWSGGGQASGQSAQQFAGGFADTASVSADVGAPGRVDAAAGSRYVEIPVSVTATRRDGSVHRYVGAYTLRRAVVDGATDEQRAWRIASADLRELQP